MKKPVYKPRFTQLNRDVEARLNVKVQEVKKYIEDACEKIKTEDRIMFDKMTELMEQEHQKYHDVVQTGLLTLSDELNRTNQICEEAKQKIDEAIAANQTQKLSNEFEQTTVVQQLQCIH